MTASNRKGAVRIKTAVTRTTNKVLPVPIQLEDETSSGVFQFHISYNGRFGGRLSCNTRGGRIIVRGMVDTDYSG